MNPILNAICWLLALMAVPMAIGGFLMIGLMAYEDARRQYRIWRERRRWRKWMGSSALVVYKGMPISPPLEDDADRH
jgi:hypothetical protein